MVLVCEKETYSQSKRIPKWRPFIRKFEWQTCDLFKQFLILKSQLVIQKYLTKTYFLCVIMLGTTAAKIFSPCPPSPVSF